MGPPGSRPGLDDITFGAAIRVGLKLEQIGLQQNHFDQLIDALLGQRGNIDENGIATPIVRNQTFVLQLLANFHRVRVGMVDLVDGDEDRHLGRLRVVQRFERLRHDAVIGRDDQHDDVGDVAPRARIELKPHGRAYPGT